MTETTRTDLPQSAPDAAPPEARGRLPYETPRLVTFGTVQALTHAQGGLPADGFDGATNGSVA